MQARSGSCRLHESGSPFVAPAAIDALRIQQHRPRSLRDKSHPGDVLPPESFVSPGDPLDISETQVTSYHAIAHDFAEKTAGDPIALGALLGCIPWQPASPLADETSSTG